jgi:hypothetical protein
MFHLLFIPAAKQKDGKIPSKTLPHFGESRKDNFITTLLSKITNFEHGGIYLLDTRYFKSGHGMPQRYSALFLTSSREKCPDLTETRSPWTINP